MCDVCLKINKSYQYDPTRTLTLRRAFSADITRRFKKIAKLIVEAIVDDDVFGIKATPKTLALPNGSFAFPRSGDKVKAFMEWLREMEEAELFEIQIRDKMLFAGNRAWQDVYIDSAYKKGIIRARLEMQKKGILQDVPAGLALSAEMVLLQPIHADRVGLLYTRAFNELKGITEAMNQQISRVLAQGIADGKGMRELARELVKRVSGDLGIKDSVGRTIPAVRRARMLARTEIIRAHHLATINMYREAGVEGVDLKAEWLTAGDGKVCPICLAMEANNPYTIDEVEGLIPAHPNCLLDGQVKIYTSSGWKPIRDVAVGDMVLTHAKRFKAVTKIHRTKRKEYGGKVEAVRFGFTNQSRGALSITANHPVLVNKKWIEAKDIKVGDKVYMLSDKCKRCGKPTEYYKNYCSRTCLSLDITDRQRNSPEHRKNISKKTSAQLHREYKLGIRDKDKITEKARKRAQEKFSIYGYPFLTSEARAKMKSLTNLPHHREASSKRMAINNPMADKEIRAKASDSLKRFYLENPEKHPNRIMAEKGHRTGIERKVGDLLDRIGIGYEIEYPIQKYFADFAVPELMITIECDGEYWHQDKKKDFARQSDIEADGWTVIRFSGSEINNDIELVEQKLARVFGNHTGEYGFIEEEVTVMKTWEASPSMLYNLSVADDESYVANGFVVHNCRCMAIPTEIKVREDK